MVDESYNGYKNYETWNVALWLDNDEPIYRIIRAMVKRSVTRGSAYTLAVKIKRFVSEEFRADGNKFGDLNTARAFRKVHFKEIAQNLFDEYQREIFPMGLTKDK